ncbi:MAG: GNAT family N-acetyltransferase [Thermomicrobiales bacterium]
MDIDIVPAELHDKPVIANLMQLYLYDFSEATGWTVNAHGIYDYRYLDHYWTEDGRFPFVIRVDGKLAGFAFIRTIETGDGPEHHLAEFFVMRAFRRSGVGTTVACQIFDRFPGRWEVAQIEQNVDAQRFWRRVIDRYTSGSYAERRDDRGRLIQEFFAGKE